MITELSRAAQVALKARFDAKWVAEPNSGCWLWTGCVCQNNYGRFSVLQRPRLAHRISYELYVGEIPEELEIDHLCRIRHCVNPEHLEPVTRLENLMRKVAVITHCPQEHEYNEENTQWTGNVRHCRMCGRLRAAARRAKRKSERQP